MTELGGRHCDGIGFLFVGGAVVSRRKINGCEMSHVRSYSGSRTPTYFYIKNVLDVPLEDQAGIPKGSLRPMKVFYPSPFTPFTPIRLNLKRLLTSPLIIILSEKSNPAVGRKENLDLAEWHLGRKR